MPLPAIIAGLAGSGVLAGAGGFLANLFGQERQHSKNMDIARFQAEANERYLDKYNEYNTPANQMKRFQEAGLNPHLVYGQGSPGNQSQPLSYPDIQKTDYQQAFSQIIPVMNQSMLAQSQVAALDAKTEQTYTVTALKEVEKRVLERNPLLNDPAFFAIIDGLLSTAELKRGERALQSVELEYQTATVALRAAKIEREIELMEQRFKLGELDGALKAEVLKSKEFQNAILEVQKKFLADGELGSQQILQFVQLLLMKIL